MSDPIDGWHYDYSTVQRVILLEWVCFTLLFESIPICYWFLVELICLYSKYVHSFIQKKKKTHMYIVSPLSDIWELFYWVYLLLRVCIRVFYILHSLGISFYVFWARDEWAFPRILELLSFPSFHPLVIRLSLCFDMSLSVFFFFLFVFLGHLLFLLLHQHTFQIWCSLYVIFTSFVDGLMFFRFLFIACTFALAIFWSMIHEIFYTYCILCTRI